MLASVSDCESNQGAWNAAIALAGGGEVWDDGELRWSWQAHDGQLMLNFPQTITLAAARRGVTEARRRGAHIIGAWLATEVDASPLEHAGFERGWEPWWMAAPLGAIAEPDDERVIITRDVPDYNNDARRLLSLVEDPGSRAWHAVARIDGRVVGRAWAFAPGAIAGIYDMDVWPGFQRRGLGRALLRSLCESARAAGAQVVVLNATPDGERLYSAESFARIGTGITYWHHLGCTT
jgi:ribosomal protein S18 acetylase RimI-like enzyme